MAVTRSIVVVLLGEVPGQTGHGSFELGEPFAERPWLLLGRWADSHTRSLGQGCCVVRHNDAVMNYAFHFHVSSLSETPITSFVLLMV
ncbi:MAG: hypothetical protein ACJ8FY_18115 [Gemmataceae bacterium]